MVTMENFNNPGEKQIVYFFQRMDIHRSLVSKYLVRAGLVGSRQLWGRAGNPYITLKDHVKDLVPVHDVSKYSGPIQFLGYVQINWMYHVKYSLGEEYFANDEVLCRMNEATLQHIRFEKHHPEYWDPDKLRKNFLNFGDRDGIPDEPVDARTMPIPYIWEMVADWMAVAEERGTDVWDWYKKTVGVRWLFEDYQVEIIRLVIEIMMEDRLDYGHFRDGYIR